MAEIVVVGSINMDVVTQIDRFPRPGETLMATRTFFSPGGKGANQAVAAARMGTKVAMVAAVGKDPFGVSLVKDLKCAEINVDSMQFTSQVATGTAVITVDRSAQNTILVSLGANSTLSATEAIQNVSIWDGCSIVLLQNEIDSTTNLTIMRYVASRGMRIFYNPAPAAPISQEILSMTDTLIVNEYEASIISGIEVRNRDSAVEAALILVENGVRSVILTLGSDGLLYYNQRQIVIYVPAFPVEAIDTTAAGDTFIGAYAAAVVNKMGTEAALRFASGAAALSVMKQGAQDSIPNRVDVDLWLQSRS